MTEVVHVVREVTGTPDPHSLLGKVRAKAELEGMGAEILENSMIIGDNAYDVVPGWAGTALSSFADHLLSPERMAARGGKTDIGRPPETDEEMLRLFSTGDLI